MKDGNFVAELVREGVISAEDGARFGDLPPAEIFRTLQEGEVDAEMLARVLAHHLGMDFVDEAQLVPEKEVAELLSAFRDRLPAVPFRRVENRVEVAVSDPFDRTLMEAIEHRIAVPFRLCVTTPSAIKAVQAGGSSARLRHREPVQVAGLPADRAVEVILEAAVSSGASDLHIEWSESATRVRFRVDGVLTEALPPIDINLHARMIQRLKVMADLDVTEKRIPQDGRFRFQVDGAAVDCRLSILPGYAEEDAVVRILDHRTVASGQALDLDLLGLPPATVRHLKRISHAPYGLLLVAGPTGSGKTTTLYAMLSTADRSAQKIVTIEDPVEYRLEGVLQIPVNEKKQLTFSRGLRSVLRHDPDKIMVGEIRDPETAEIAVQSALTGHLVLSTVHANSALDVIGRLTHMGVDAYTLVNVLSGVLAQRLVRKLCTHCKQPANYSPERLRESGISAHGGRFFTANGCERCQDTGFDGRTTVSEFLVMSPAVRRALTERIPLDDLQAIAREEGMAGIRSDAVRKLEAGETSLEEIDRVSLVQ